jgi:hypothetical protein
MRPKIICHMVSSIDGRLLVDRWTPPAAGVDEDIVLRYDEVAARFDADGWIVGRATMDGLTGSPCIIDHAGEVGERPGSGLSLRHLATETLEGGMVWIHYRVEASP